MQIHDVEQGTSEWLMLRSGLPTASNFSKMVTSTGKLSKSIDDYALSLACDLFAKKPLDEWLGNQWTDRGTELEPDARSMYEFQKDCTVKEVGFITNAGWGCSPDGLINDDGMVEFKCLKAENHVKTILDYNRTGNIPTKYIAQVQGQMLIAERQYCDLVFYHPDLPIKIIRIVPDSTIINGLLEAQAKVLNKRDLIVAELENENVK
jgi:hypothetical protein